MSDNLFKEIENRDAWSTIRGYVYQVDLTILRWLSLGDNEVLELEKGEDIDIVNKSIEKENFRELEQIKYRESTVSLNQTDIIEILFNFFVHKTNNPNHTLLFRFVTNTEYNIERPALFDGGRSGIEVWSALHDAEEISPNDERLVVIQKHISRKIEENISKKGEKSTDETEDQKQWKRFKSYIEDADSFIDFIRGFEWSLNYFNHQEIRSEIESKLLEKGIEQRLAEEVYSRLFLFVFKLLTNSALKTLSKADLSSQLTLHSLSETDHKLISFFKVSLSNIDQRFSDLEDRSNKNAAQIFEVISELASIQKFDSAFEYRLHNLSSNAPALIRSGAAREIKVKEIIVLITDNVWVALQGINGTGKTQLAALVFEKCGNKFWLDLRPFADDEEKCFLVLESFLYTITNCEIVPDRNIWIQQVVNSLPVEFIIVLNDVPNISNGSSLAFLLKKLVENLHIKNGKLLTTSNCKISSEFKEQFDQNAIIEYYDLEFTDEEIEEILTNNNAPQKVFEYLDIIVIVSKRNPRLVNAIIHRLKQMNWGNDEAGLIDSLFKNELTEEVLQDAQSSIKKNIPDQYSRELLYRLSLIYWDFRFKEVSAVSNVDRVIPHPNEKFQDLVNIWIQKNEGSFSISPIISNIGEQNLTEEVVRNVHSKIAATIISETPLNQITASRCISSFLKASDEDSASSVLLSIYHSTQTPDEAKWLQKWGYLSYWKTKDLPSQVNVTKRAIIRSEQIRLTMIAGGDANIFQKYLESYTQESFDNLSSELSVRLLYLPYSQINNLKLFISSFQFVIDHLDKIESELKAIVKPEMIGDLLWLPVQKIINKEDIELWLNLVSSADGKLGLSFFSKEIAITAVSMLAEKIANSENVKPDSEKDIAGIKDRLELLIKYFENNGFENLAAVVARNNIVIEYRYYNNPAEAEKLSLFYIERYDSDEAKYFVYENYGKLLYKDKKTTEAKTWLKKATTFAPVPNINFIDTLVYYASAVSEEEPKEAVISCERAVNLAEKEQYADEFEYIQVVAELAVAYWIYGENDNSFVWFEKILSKLLEIRDKKYGKDWIRIFSFLGHSLGYIAPAVAKDKVPQSLKDGSQYTKPYQGIFLFSTSDLSDWFKPENIPIICALLATFADGINNVSKAYQWSLKAFDLARRNGDERIVQMVSIACSQYALINFKAEETFESYLRSTVVMNYLPGGPEEKYIALGKSSYSEIVKSKPSKEWNDAEATTLLFAIVPLFVMVLNAQLEKSPDADQKQREFLYMLNSYIGKSSDKELWQQFYSLCSKILSKLLSESELQILGNQFAERELTSHQAICVLGIIYITRSAETIVEQLINVFPFLVKVQHINTAVVKFVFVPFVKERSLFAFSKSFVGTKQDLDRIVDIVGRIDASDKNAIQDMLKPIVSELELDSKIKDDRKLWLYEYKNI